MGIIDKLASSVGRRDEEPNIELAKAIAARKDKPAVKELVELLEHKNKDIQNDSIKVLYETGGIAPELIVPYIPVFAGLLVSKNNRLQWGAMTALQAVTTESPAAIFSLLGRILDAADKGSVITRDKCVQIMSQLASVKKYTDEVFPLLIEQILQSPVNQLPMYAELTLPAVNNRNKDSLINALFSRLEDLDQESKRKRIDKVIAKAKKL